MKRSISTLILAMAAIIGLHAMQPAPATILADAARKLHSAPSLTITFTATSDESSSSGTIVLSGDKFRLSTPDMTVWYDGHTQWSYMHGTAEVNITEPTPEELGQINPFVIVNTLRDNFNPSTARAPKGFYKLVLTPKSRSTGIDKAIVTLNASTYYPADVEVDTDNGTHMSIKVNSVKAGANLPVSTFVFNKSAHKGVEVIDLR